MKILIVSHYFKPHVGGVEIIAYNQAKSLVAHGHKVTVISSKTDEGIEQKDGIIVKKIKIINYFENKFNIPYPIFSTDIVFSLIKEIRDTDICHIHDVFYISSILSAVIAKIFKKPVVVTQHVGYVYHKFFIIMLMQWVVYNTAGKFIFKTSKKIITFNPIVSSFVQSIGMDKTKIVQINNGVDLNLFSIADEKTKRKLRRKYSLPSNKKIILFVGRFVAKKGYEKLFNARDKRYLTIFIGTGNVPQHMKMDSSVKFLNGIKQSHLADYYKLSDLFILPSSGEVFTLAMQEAMASGLPIITTKEKEYKYYKLNHKLIKFISLSTRNIKKSIGEVLSNKELRDRMSRYSYDYSQEKLNWDKNMLDVINIYSQVVK